MSRYKKGFTFIEMLVVITIIAVLTGIGVTSYRVANQKARDGRRKADLEQIRAALELYRADQGEYPASVDWPAAGDPLTAGGVTYMSEIPGDPDSNYVYHYADTASQSAYDLCAYLETDDSGNCGNASCGDETCNYKINNPL